MRCLILDFEATSVDPQTARITELGFIVWESDTKRPLVAVSHLFYEESYEAVFTPETVKMMEEVCSLTPAMLKEFGMQPKTNLEWLERYCEEHAIKVIVCHNGRAYDHPLMLAELARHGIEAPYLKSLPLIDTRFDIPYEKEPDSRKLKYVAADHGFIPTIAHRALFDCASLCRILDSYDFSKVVELSKVPMIIVRALVNYEGRQLAKDLRFSWEKVADKSYPKTWVKQIRENQFEAEKALAAAKGFEIVKIT